MPYPVHAERAFAPPSMRMRVVLEPAAGALDSLMMLNSVAEISGLGEWVVRTAAALTPEQSFTNRVVLIGLYFAVTPDRSWPSFEAYVEHLAATPPEELRDRVLRGVLSRAATPPDQSSLLASADAYLAYLHEYFPAALIDEQVEREAHRLLSNPEEMRRTIVAHLRTMWSDYLEVEWQRVAPLLEESVAALRDLPLAGLAPLEAVRLVTGHELLGERQRIIDGATEILFVPSAHTGVYLNTFNYGDRLWLIFGARLPEGARMADSELARSELLVRLAALTDDTRLRMLALLSQHTELFAQEIMARLEITQSATSRHLRQLSAAGYVVERRREGAKSYTLNRARIRDTARVLERFVGA